MKIAGIAVACLICVVVAVCLLKRSPIDKGDLREAEQAAAEMPVAGAGKQTEAEKQQKALLPLPGEMATTEGKNAQKKFAAIMKAVAAEKAVEAKTSKTGGGN